jgi:hypothetical protein
MDQCTNGHVRCNAAVPEGWSPTRLLDVGTSQDDLVQLVTGDGINLEWPYATFSHCWGREPFRKTTSATLSEFLDVGIRLERLRRTFREAIDITRRLKLRYLWIDALCIIQDSADDWTKEVNLMSEVYRYSFLNIAATGAKDISEGCFWDRNERNMLPTEVHIQWHNSQQDRTKEVAAFDYSVVLEANMWARKLTKEPLNRRGWILQERILPNRVLHFGSEQLFWECRESVACETYHHGLPAT